MKISIFLYVMYKKVGKHADGIDEKNLRPP